MMRRLVSLAFVGLAAVIVSLSAAPAVGEDAPRASATIAVQRIAVTYPALRDEVTMVLVGVALIGLAAAVRKA